MGERDLGLQETPAYLRPIAKSINIQVLDIRNELMSEINRSSRQAVAQRAVLDALPTTPYDGVQLTASQLVTTLSPHRDTYIGMGKNDEFKMLSHNLPSLEVLEHGGLSAVNARMTELFTSLRSAETTEAQAQAMDGLNDLMYAAMYVFPHLATGVEVKLAPGTEGKGEEFWSKFGMDAGAQRNKYDDLRRVYEEQHGQPFPDRLVMPLPYGFTTGTHGSGERAAMGASRDTVAFGFTHPDRNWSAKIPVLKVEVEAPLIVSRMADFTLDEVEGIQFTYDDKYTPWVESYNRQPDLLDRGNPVMQYLRFRDFADFVNFRKRENLQELTEEEWRASNTILTPSNSFGNLWSEDWRTFRRKLLRRGFIAVPADRSADVKLYEYTNFTMPLEDVHEAQALLYARVMRKGPEAMGVLEFSGMDVVSRLLEVPVEARRF